MIRLRRRKLHVPRTNERRLAQAIREVLHDERDTIDAPAFITVRDHIDGRDFVALVMVGPADERTADYRMRMQHARRLAQTTFYNPPQGVDSGGGG